MSDGQDSPVPYPAQTTAPRLRTSIRVRLLAIALLPTLVVLPVFLVITALNWSARLDHVLTAKVNGELTIAHQYMARILENSGLRLQAVGDSAAFHRILAQGDEQDLQRALDRRRTELGFDFLYFTDGAGRVVSSPASAHPMTPSKWPVVSSALAGTGATQIDLFDAAEIGSISPELAKAARIALVPTRAAVPTERAEETRGMVVHSAAPVMLGSERGALVGGVLLNRNLRFIDTINDLVYPTASLTEGSQGTATLFLDDVRVSTNVRLFQDRRALGTRVSAIVRQTVLEEGHVWLDRAFVVNDWYVSAYEPIVDSFGQRVGMLYVGFLEAPYKAAKRTTYLTFVAAFAAIVLVTVPVFLRWARQIFRPLEQMMGTIAQVEDGNLGARTGVTNTGDEIGRVAGQMDELLEQVQERDRELMNRVAERTRELHQANQRLEATTKQLVVSEKLAAVGEIAAGIAHEINNPIAVIQGNLDVIRAELGAAGAPLDLEFRLIDEQVHSIFLIVNKLLQFTRPDEYAGFSEQHSPDAAIRDSIPLVQHLLNRVAIRLDLQLSSTRVIAINRTELQQVLINLIVNAIHAMGDGGTLSISSTDADHDNVQGVRITIADTGRGMPPEVLTRVFDPFFTTKQAEGTGLGLSITRKLVERYGGHIMAESQLGEGTSFTIWLPADDALSD